MAVTCPDCLPPFSWMSETCSCARQVALKGGFSWAKAGAADITSSIAAINNTDNFLCILVFPSQHLPATGSPEEVKTSGRGAVFPGLCSLGQRQLLLHYCLGRQAGS